MKQYDFQLYTFPIIELIITCTRRCNLFLNALNLTYLFSLTVQIQLLMCQKRCFYLLLTSMLLFYVDSKAQFYGQKEHSTGYTMAARSFSNVDRQTMVDTIVKFKGKEERSFTCRSVQKIRKPYLLYIYPKSSCKKMWLPSCPIRVFEINETISNHATCMGNSEKQDAAVKALYKQAVEASKTNGGSILHQFNRNALSGL